MNDLYFDTEEEQEQAARASDPRNFALCAAHVNAVYKTDFAEWFLRMLALRQTRRARPRWEEELPDRQQWRLKHYQLALASERDTESKAKKRRTADRKRAKAFRVCAEHGIASEDWSEGYANWLEGRCKLEKSRRALARFFADRVL